MHHGASEGTEKNSWNHSLKQSMIHRPFDEKYSVASVAPWRNYLSVFSLSNLWF